MKLIHVVPAISSEASGPSYSVVRLCESLIGEQHQLTLAALDWAPLANSPSFLKTFAFGLGPRRLGRSPDMAQWLATSCSDDAIDVVHNHGMWQMNAVYPAWATRNRKVVLVYSPRGAFSEWAMQQGSVFKKPFWYLLQYPALRQVACFHATAEDEYRDIRRLGFRQPVAIVPNGIDLPSLSGNHLKHSQRTLLFLSRIHRVKGLENLLVAWSKVQASYPAWRLKIVGGDGGYHESSGYLAYLKSMAETLGLRDVEFAGPLYGEDKLKAYNEAELFVLPTFSENFGVAVAEALSTGTPTIVSRGAPWGGLDTIGAGWWVDIGAEPLATCLQDALSRSPEDLATMGARGRAWMEAEFSWASIGEKISQTYAWLCDRSRPLPACVRLD